MVEGHVEHLRHGHVLLVCPSEEVGDVLQRGADTFGAEEAAGFAVGIYAQAALVHQHHAAAALVFERYFADDKFVGLVLCGNLRVFQTDKADLRTGEHHTDGAAA